MKHILTVSIIMAFVVMNSCQNEEESVEIEKDKGNLNTFSMILNENIWTPSIIDPCTQTFQCNMSILNDDNFYKIEAFKDPLLIANLESENRFELQIMKLNDVGSYAIDGEFGSFESYSRLTINEEGTKKIYQNKKIESSFKVDVAELLVVEHSSLVGLKGSFSGFLYNVEDVRDSIMIEDGEFIFKKINRYNFNQCQD